MKNNLILLLLMVLLSSCESIQYTHYIVSVFNSSSSEILISYETIEKVEEVLLHNNINEAGQHKNIYISNSFDGDIGKYQEEEFSEKIINVKISVINGTDTIPVSRNFAPFENWDYRENYDDNTLDHKYQLVITDELID